MKKRIALILALLLVVAIGCISFFSANYVLINGEIIDQDATEVTLVAGQLPDVQKLQKIDHMEVLDLRELEVSIADFDMLCAAFPNCEIRWIVPFQDGCWDNSVTEIVVTAMTPEYEAMLKYFPHLKTVDARGCNDYDALMNLIQHRSDLQVIYNVDLGDTQLREDATDCVVNNENVLLLLEYLPYLTNLQRVDALECTDYETLMAIRETRPELELIYCVQIGQVPQAADASVVTLEIEHASEAFELLQYFPNLTEVSFVGLAEDLELMCQMMERYPNIVITWSFELYGVETSSTAKELILNNIPMESTQTVEDALKCFYNLEWVEMCQCGISSEDMDALWKRHPETRFVWAIPMANGYVRTDVKAFIPFKYGFYIDYPFYDKQAKELKYLVDLECLDLGHMRMTDISFLQYMPKLRFLILADVICKDFSYLANLTNLEYLELFRSDFDDVQLLMNLKNLQDLNIGWTYLKNPELLKEMTWLKRLWTNMNGMTRLELKELRDAMPDTYVYIDSLHPTEGGWRQSDLYYEMRDMLGMFYMK